MKFSINRNAFLERINTVTKAITLPPAQPVLSGVYLNAEKDCLTLKASDKKLTIQTKIFPGELTNLSVEEPGQLVLEARFLSEIVRKLEDEIIQIETESLEDGGRKIAQISDNHNMFKMNYLDHDALSVIDFDEQSNDLQMKAKDIKNLVKEVGFCTAPESETRACLKGIHLKSYPDGIYAFGTDAYRFARKRMDYLDNSTELKEFAITIPLRTLKELAKSLSDDESIVNISINRRNIRFDVDKTIYQSLLLDGKYPDLDKITPKDGEGMTTLSVNGPELSKCVDRATVFFDLDHELLRFYLSDQEIRLHAQTDGVGETDLNLFGGSVSGDPLKLTCNGKFVLDSLRALNALEDVVIEFHGELHPFKISDPQNKDLIMVIVPVRTYD